RHRHDQGRPPAGHPREGERRRGLPVRRQAEGTGELHRPAADGLLPGRRGDRRRPGRRHQHPRHRRARPRHHDLQGTGNRPRHRPRHPQHHRVPSLTQCGEKPTPNQHALAEQFGLYDNVYDVGTNSAEGHNWLMQGDNPEYSESSAGEYQRSYDTEEDVLGHQRSGFLWTAVESAGNTARNYGEYEYMEGKPPGTWQQYYCATKSVMNGGDPAQLTTSDLKGDYG